MGIYIIRRLLQTILVLIGITILVFSVLHFMPGDPALIMAGERADLEQVEQMRENLGLNDPLPQQYFNYITRLLRGDMGESIRTNTSVSSEIFDVRLGNTIRLAIISTLLTAVFGMATGILCATRKYSVLDRTIMLLMLFGLSMPVFWLALLLMFFLSVQLGILPVAYDGTWQGLVIPVITLASTGAAIVSRMTRSSLLDVFNQDYIRTAYSKGLSKRVVIYKHALKNALIPVITVVGLQFGSLLGGAVITETIFAINGIGRLLVDSIRAHDFPMVQGVVLVFALFFTTVNLIVDITYRFLNKRIDLG